MGTGKVKKFEVRDAVTKHIHSGEEPIVTVDDELLMTHPEAHYLCELLMELAPRKVPLFPSTLLSVDLGLDSLRLTELVLRLEKKYRVTFPMEEMATISTIRDAIAFLGRCLTAPGAREEGEAHVEPGTRPR